MNQNALVVAEVAELVWLNLVLLGLGVIHSSLACAVAPGALDDALLAEKVRGLDGIGFLGGAENETVAEIEGQHFGLVISEGRYERGRALRGGNYGCACL